jgi:ATP-dependent phosphoenolpyruvate carboxykinase
MFLNFMSYFYVKRAGTEQGVFRECSKAAYGQEFMMVHTHKHTHTHAHTHTHTHTHT